MHLKRIAEKAGIKKESTLTYSGTAGALTCKHLTEHK